MSVRQLKIETPIRRLTLVADDQGLTRILFANQSLASVGLSADDVPEVSDDAVLNRAAEQLAEYFAGQRRTFELPLHIEGANFEREAWRALQAIPYGTTISYSEEAEYIGRPNAFRAVGRANSHNPLPIVLPCHRVVGADGSLIGFVGGLVAQRWLLDHESGTPQLHFKSQARPM